MPLALLERVLLPILARFVPDPEQRQKAIDAARLAYVQFLQYTSGPLYQLYRIVLSFAGAGDLIFNGAEYGARVARNAGIHPAIMVAIEIYLMLWPFAGEKLDRLLDIATGAMAQTFAAVFSKTAVSVGQNKPAPPNGTKPDRPGREDP